MLTNSVLCGPHFFSNISGVVCMVGSKKVLEKALRANDVWRDPSREALMSALSR